MYHFLYTKSGGEVFLKTTMKKIFITGLWILLIVFTFTSSNFVQSVDVKKYRYMARGIGANSPYIDFTEVYEDGKFTKAIINTISDGETVFDVYMVSNYGHSDTNFDEFFDIYSVKHKYVWKDNCCWWIDTTDFDYYFTSEDGTKAQIVGVEFGQCNCLCNDHSHFVMNFKTTIKGKKGRYSGISYICSLTELDE